jgi:inner membrane protein
VRRRTLRAAPPEVQVDPVSQAVVGAVAAQAAFTRRLGARAALYGAVGGALADADVLIRSAADPLLAVEMHRHFTHSLAFVPLGGVLAALPFLVRRGGREHWRAIVAACTLGYATHAPLDILTSYGTLWLWPFSRERLELDWMSIVDPLFTLPLLLLCLLAALRASRRIALAAVAFGLLYIAAGGVLHERTATVASSLAASRGHSVTHARAMPTLGNLLVWRSAYVADGAIHADAIRVAPWAAPAVLAGASVALVDAPPLAEDAPVALRLRYERDFGRFSWFADGFVARDPADPTVLGDMRYSLSTEGFAPLWGVRFHADGRAVPVEWVSMTGHRGRDGLAELWQLVTGRSPRLRAWFL